jgi:Protein of unknown function (DUF998)
MSGNLAMFCAVSGAIWLVAMVVIGGAAWDGYDHVSQYISELGATGAPHGWQVSWLGFLPIGLLITAFAFFAWRAAPRSALATIGFVGIFLFAIGYTGSAFFPCDFGCRPDNPSFSQVMHELIGLAGYLLAPVTLLLLALAARTWPGAMWLAVLGFIAAPLALVGLSGLMDSDSPTLGLYQRVLEATVIGWVVACGLYLGAQSKTAAPL